MEERSQQGKNVCAGLSVSIPIRGTSYKQDLFWKNVLNHVTKLETAAVFGVSVQLLLLLYCT